MGLRGRVEGWVDGVEGWFSLGGEGGGGCFHAAEPKESTHYYAHFRRPWPPPRHANDMQIWLIWGFRLHRALSVLTCKVWFACQAAVVHQSRHWALTNSDLRLAEVDWHTNPPAAHQIGQQVETYPSWLACQCAAVNLPYHWVILTASLHLPWLICT